MSASSICRSYTCTCQTREQAVEIGDALPSCRMSGSTMDDAHDLPTSRELPKINELYPVSSTLM